MGLQAPGHKGVCGVCFVEKVFEIMSDRCVLAQHGLRDSRSSPGVGGWHWIYVVEISHLKLWFVTLGSHLLNNFVCFAN